MKFKTIVKNNDKIDGQIKELTEQKHKLVFGEAAIETKNYADQHLLLTAEADKDEDCGYLFTIDANYVGITDMTLDQLKVLKKVLNELF